MVFGLRVVAFYTIISTSPIVVVFPETAMLDNILVSGTDFVIRQTRDGCILCDEVDLGESGVPVAESCITPMRASKRSCKNRLTGRARR
jgi:hypothetical protein